MAESNNQPVGAISWFDLTVKNANETRDFYQAVVGWQVTDVDMGEYKDYCMNEPASGKTVAGICHAQGGNAALPPMWIMYITVENLDKSLAACEELGGKIVAPTRSYGGYGRFCIIQDPAGAVAALFEHAAKSNDE